MTYEEKRNIVREQIVESAQIYSQLAGKYYLYIFDKYFFEMYFGTENFMHLTGAGSALSPNQFYQLAKQKKLESHQIFFQQRFPLRTAIKKTKYLRRLPSFTTEGCFIISDLKTATVTYPYAITNTDQSLLLGLRAEGGNVYVPKSFRVKGNILDKAEKEKLFAVQYIFSKTDWKGPYDILLYRDKNSDEIEKLGWEVQQKTGNYSL